MWNSKNRYIIQGNAEKQEMDMYHAIIASTYACNLRCKHCYLPDFSNRRISLPALEKFINEWASIVEKERGIFGGIFHLKGGEPFLDKHFTDIVSYVINTGKLRLMITTNGTIWRDDLFEMLGNAFDVLDGNVIVNISLDGATKETHEQTRGADTYDRTVRMVTKLVAMDIPVHINFVLTSKNMHEVKDIVQIAKQLGVLQVNILPFNPEGQSRENKSLRLPPLKAYEVTRDVYDKGDESTKSLLCGTLPDIKAIEEQKDEGTCECVAGYKGLYYISPTGDTYSCPALMAKGYKIGNIESESIVDIHSRSGSISIGDTSAKNASDYICKGVRLMSEERKETDLLEDAKALNLHLNKTNKPKRKNTNSYCVSRNI